MGFRNMEEAMEELSTARMEEAEAVEHVMEKMSDMVDSLTALEAISQKRVVAAKAVSRYIENTTSPGGTGVTLKDLEPVLNQIRATIPYLEAYKDAKKEH